MKMKKIDRMAYASKKDLKERDYWLNKLSGDLFKRVFSYDYDYDYDY